MEENSGNKNRSKKEAEIPSGHPSAKNKTVSRYIPIIVLIFLIANIIAVGYISYQNYSKHFRLDVEDELTTIANLKSSEISYYIEERIGNGGMLFRRSSFYDSVRRFFENPEDTKNTDFLKGWLERYATHYQYVGMSIIDAQGATRLNLPAGAYKNICPVIQKRLPEILSKDRVQLGDFCRDDSDDRIYLSVLVPILNEDKDSQPLGVLVLLINPETYLYPFIDKWPVPSETAETLLVRRDGNDTLFLNNLRFQKNSALNLRLPIDPDSDLPAAKAALGQAGIVTGRDYRGVPVVAYVRAIDDTPWFMIARVDASEAYAPMRRQLWSMVGLIISSIIAMCAIAWLIWRRQKLIFYKSQYLSAEALRSSEERYRRLFESSKDGILLVEYDTGLILDVNPFLIELLGYSRPEIVKKHLWEVGAFKNVIASKAGFASLHNKEYFRYENQPLEARDGKIITVEFISNVHTSDSKKIIQCNIRDITVRKRLERELFQAKETQYKTLIENLPQKVFLKDRNSVYISCNENYAKDLKIKAEEVSGKTDNDFFPEYLAEKYREDDKRVMNSGETENIEEEFVVMKDFLRGAQKVTVQ